MLTSILLSLVALGPVEVAEAPAESGSLLNQFLVEREAGTMVALADRLESLTLTEDQVQQLLRAAQIETSEERMIILWHALRCSRSRAAREYLLRHVADDAEETMQVRFVQSLTHLAPFDVPLLTALYGSGADPTSVEHKGPLQAAGEPTLADEVLKLATRNVSELGPALRPLPEFVASRPSNQMLINDLRQKRAGQAQADLLVWIAQHPASEAHRLSAVEAALECLEGEHQEQFARDMLAAVQEPEARARLIPQLFRRYAFDPYPLLVDDQETEGTKLAVIRGLHLFASSYGYSLSALDHGRETLRYVGQADASAKVRAAALKLLARIEGKVGEGR